MIYVDIDIAQVYYFSSAIPSDGKKLIKSSKFTNSNNSFQMLISKIDSPDKNSLIICLELTAHYSNNHVQYLIAQNNKVKMFKCESKVFKYALVNAVHNVVKNNTTSRLTMISNWLKIGATLMSLCTMPTNSLESSRK